MSLAAAPVVEGEHEVEAVVPGRELGRFGHVASVPVRYPGIVEVPHEPHPHTLFVQFVASPGEQVFVEPHEELDFFGIAIPILGREGVGGQPADPDLDGSVDGVEQGRLSGGVAGRPGQTASIGPTAVPIEDQPDMSRDPIEDQAGSDRVVRRHRPGSGWLLMPSIAEDRQRRQPAIEMELDETPRYSHRFPGHGRVGRREHGEIGCRQAGQIGL